MRGGKRPGAGRKKLNTTPLCLQVDRDLIQFMGGIHKTREYLYHQLKVYKK